MSFTLPDLPYSYDAMEPYIDKETMKIHHTKHHQNYINNANSILNNLLEFNKLPVDDLIQYLDQIPIDKKTSLRNNAGGHANHNLFWNSLKQGVSLPFELKNALEHNFGSFDTFKQIFENTAATYFGSGWTWLVKKEGKLVIVTTANQDNPLMGENISGTSGYPILGLDLWEHAYYLKYRNCRIDYIKVFWNIVNWEAVAIRFNNN